MWNLISLDGFFEVPEPWSLDGFDHSLMTKCANIRWSSCALPICSYSADWSYEGMAAYWASEHGEDADLMNGLPKVVFSRTFDRTEWRNTTLSSGDEVSEIRRLKSVGEGNLFVFGSADLSSTLMGKGLFSTSTGFASFPSYWAMGSRCSGATSAPTKLKLT